MTTVTVYDPPMCCSTGVCGPEVDPKLAQFAGDLNWLKAQGVEVRRINLAQEPARFVENATVKAVLDWSGGDELPAILVGDELIASGRYPSRDELATLAGLNTASVKNILGLADRIPGAEEPTAATSSCCGGAKTTQEKASSCC